MSEETAKYEVQEYQTQELVDDALASGIWNDALRNEYVYEFKQSGKLIRGLTASAISHIAQEQGISITSVEKEVLNDGVLYTATARREPEGLERQGVAYEPFVVNGKPDKFCWQKALTKASRNAMRQLIPATMQQNAIHQLLTMTDAEAQKALPVATETKEKPPPAQKGDEGYWMKRTFAQFNERKPDLEKAKINKFVFWAVIRDRYNVASRTELTDAHWEEIDQALRRETFPKWILDMKYPPIKCMVYARLEEMVSHKVITDPADFWERAKSRTGATPDTMTTKHWQTCLDILDEMMDDSSKEDNGQSHIPM